MAPISVSCGTGRQEYLFMGEGYGAGLTPLLDASGRPVVSSYTGHGGEDVKY